MTLAMALVGCNGVRAESGAREPIRVPNAMYTRGELPGTPPEIQGDAGPVITSIENPNGIIRHRQLGKMLNGRTSPDAFAVAMQFAGLGNGYWTVPVGGPDPTANNELVWTLTADFSDDIPTGIQALRFVAMDGEGHAGPQRDVAVCVVGEVEDNLNACDPTLAPPYAVLTLGWDTDMDLDLRVQTPDGRFVEWKRPTSAVGDGGVIRPGDLGNPALGVLDRDANAECRGDGVRRETVVFQSPPVPGTYRVFANVYDACGQSQVFYRLSVRKRALGEVPGTFAAVETQRADGQLLGLNANGGTQPGAWLADVELP